MDSADSFVTAASNAENPIVTDVNVYSQEEDDPESDSSEEVVDVAHANAETEAANEHLHGENEPNHNPQVVPEAPIVLPTTTVTPPTTSEVPHVESSSNDESCGAYIARKWEQLGCF